MDALFVEIESSLTQYSDTYSSKQDQLRQTCQALRSEVGQLRTENTQLREEVNRLRAGDAGGAVGSVDFVVPTSGPYRQAKIIRGHEAPVHAVSMSPTGLLATASWDATVKVYDLLKSDDEALVRTLGVESGGEGAVLGGAMGGLYGVAFAPCASHVLGCVSADRYVYLWNHETGECINRLEGHRDEINGIAFHHTQKVMCTTSDDGSAIIWDFAEGSTLRVLSEHTAPVYGATFLGAESEFCVATCCFDRFIRIFDMRTKAVVQQLQAHDDDIIGIDYNDVAVRLASGSDDGTILIWDARNWGEPVYEIDTRAITESNEARRVKFIPQGNEVKRVKFNVDGTKVACGCSSNQALIYDLSSGEPTLLSAMGGHQQCVFDVCWGMDPGTGEEYLVDASHDMTSFVWRAS